MRVRWLTPLMRRWKGAAAAGRKHGGAEEHLQGAQRRSSRHAQTHVQEISTSRTPTDTSPTVVAIATAHRPRWGASVGRENKLPQILENNSDLYFSGLTKRP